MPANFNSLKNRNLNRPMLSLATIAATGASAVSAASAETRQPMPVPVPFAQAGLVNGALLGPAREQTTVIVDPNIERKQHIAGGLGGVAGTGFSPAELNKVKRYAYGNSNFTGSHSFHITTYGPPWNSIEGTGVTSTGVHLGDGRRLHMVAVDPEQIPYGTLLKVWPNPLHYKGDFVADDKGGLIGYDDIDVYDWLDGGNSTFSAYGAMVKKVTVESPKRHHRQPWSRGFFKVIAAK